MAENKVTFKLRKGITGSEGWSQALFFNCAQQSLAISLPRTSPGGGCQEAAGVLAGQPVWPGERLEPYLQPPPPHGQGHVFIFFSRTGCTGCGLPCVIKQFQPFLQLETVWKNEYFPNTLTKGKQREGKRTGRNIF